MCAGQIIKCCLAQKAIKLSNIVHNGREKEEEEGDKSDWLFHFSVCICLVVKWSGRQKKRDIRWKVVMWCDCARWSQGPNGSRFLSLSFSSATEQNSFVAVSKNKAQFNLATVIFLATEIEEEEKKRTDSLSKMVVVINANIGQIGRLPKRSRRSAFSVLSPLIAPIYHAHHSA